MYKFLLFSFLLIFFAIEGNAQKQASLIEHYKNEYQTFKEFIKYSELVKGDTSIDVKFYFIDIEIGIYSPYINGEVTIIFEPLYDISMVDISLNSALTVDEISSPCLTFGQNNDVIEIELDDVYGPGELVELTISYSGVPVMAGGYKGMRYESHGNNEPIIATLSTPYLAHYWYPCKDGPQDKPDSVFMDITIPDEEINGIPLMGVSNGILENVIDNGDTKTFQWRHRYPIVTYYVMAAVSNYDFFQDEYNAGGITFPLDYYVFQESMSSAQAGVGDLPDVIEVFSEKFGPYPFANEKYGMTQLGFYGAIENQTNTIQNNLSSSWFYTTIHELGHMWFGDMITLSNWHHGWLNEGFATYSEAIWDEHLYGFSGYKSHMTQNEYWNGGTLYFENAADTFNTFQSIIYSKGAYAVHMLRGVLGDDVFFDALLDYSNSPDFMYKNASTEDLQQSFENSSGLDLEFFFDQWVYDEYWPFYHYNFAQNSNNEVYVVIYQAQEELYGYRPVFEMPVQVKLNYANGGDTTITVWNDEQTQQFYFNLDQEISTVVIDPDKWILRKSQFKPDIPVLVLDSKLDNRINLFPNPFSGEINILIEDATNEHFVVSIIDLQGRLIKQLYNNRLQKDQLIKWDARNSNGVKVATGTYLVEFRSHQGSTTRHIILME